MSTTSSGALTRAQSLRKPTTRTETSANNATASERTTRIAANGTGTARMTTARTSRPLSGVFGHVPSSSPRQRDVDSSTISNASSATVPAATSRLTRAASLRQLSNTAAASSSLPSADGPTPSRLARAPSIRKLSTTSARTAPASQVASIVSDTSAPVTSRLTRATSIRQLSTVSNRSAASSDSTTTATATTTTTTSTRRPTSSSGVAPSSRPRGASTSMAAHARAKPSVTALATANSTALRPPSQSSATSTSTVSTTTATAPRTQPPVARSTSTAARTTISTRPKSLHLPSSPPKLSKKPSFSTHTQSFTPLKPPQPKALTSTFLAPPSPSKLPSNVAISAETAKLQTVLLQLHVLHRSWFPTRSAYYDSARDQLSARFEQVRDLEREALRLERESLEAQGTRELLSWASAGGDGMTSGPKLEKKIQVLDFTVQTVWGLTDPGGKYAKLVRRFEKWLARAEGIMASREADRGMVAAGVELELIGKIMEDEREWEGLERKLGELKGGLRELEGGEGCSGEKGGIRMVKWCVEMVRGMLEEFEVMRELEREILKREMAWVKRMNRDGEDVAKQKRAGAIWRGL